MIREQKISIMQIIYSYKLKNLLFIKNTQSLADEIYTKLNKQALLLEQFLED